MDEDKFFELLGQLKDKLEKVKRQRDVGRREDIPGSNKNIKRRAPAARGSARRQVALDVAEAKRRSKEQPVKTFTPKEIEAENKKGGLSTKKNDEIVATGLGKEEKMKKPETVDWGPNGQWKLSKYGSMATMGSMGNTGSAGIAGANKSEDESKNKNKKKS
jgi:hypothetical protein